MSRLANRLGLRVFDVDMGIFEFSVRVVVGNEEKAEEYAAHIYEVKGWRPDVSLEDTRARGRCFFHPGYVPIIWIPGNPKTPREYATLAHEIVHAVNHLFNWAHIYHVDDTDEVFAHAVGHIMNSTIEALREKPKR